MDWHTRNNTSWQTDNDTSFASRNNTSWHGRDVVGLWNDPLYTWDSQTIVWDANGGSSDWYTKNNTEWQE